MTSDESDECPLCMEPFEVDDMSFYPCTCGYQICRFCWHRLKIDGNGLCPACRKPYSENPAHFEPLSEDEIIRIKKERRHKEVQKKQKLSENRRHLADVRVVQKNLVFVVGLSQRLADSEVLKKIEYFGRFGKIMKVVINSSPSYAGTQTPSASAYLTYSKPDEALRAIQTVNNVQIDNRILKASLGTTKYCSHFLKGIQCPKADCMYLHDLGEEAASFTKEQMSQGKHLDYESKLIELFLHIPRNLQNISTSNADPSTLTNQTNLSNLPNTIPSGLPGSTTPPAVQSSSSSSNLSSNSTNNTSSTSSSSVTPSSTSTSNSTSNLDKTETNKIKTKTKSSNRTNITNDKTSSSPENSDNFNNNNNNTNTNLKDDINNLINDDVSLDNTSRVKTIETISNKIDNNGQNFDKTESTESEFNKFTMNNISNTNNHNTSTSYENLNGRLDSNGLLNNFADLNLKQEEDLGFDPWGESTKALQDLMKMEKVVTPADQLDTFENLAYLKGHSTLNTNIFNLLNSTQNSTAAAAATHAQNSHTTDVIQRPLSNGQANMQQPPPPSTSSSSSSASTTSSSVLNAADPVKLNPSLYNSLTNTVINKQQHRESLNDPNALFQNSLLMNSSLLNDNHSNKFNDLAANHHTHPHHHHNPHPHHFASNDTLEYFNQENYLNKLLIKNNLSKLIVPPPGFNNASTNPTTNTFNSPLSAPSSTNSSSSSSTSSSVNNSTSTTPALNPNLLNQAKQIAYHKLNANLVNKKDNDKLKSLVDSMNDYSSQDLNTNKNSFNLNSDDLLHQQLQQQQQQHQQQNMLNITKSFQETFRSVFPNAHISFGAAQANTTTPPPPNLKMNSMDQAASSFQQQQHQQQQQQQQMNTNKTNQYMLDDQLMKRNCWPDDPAIVSLNDGSNDLAQRLDKLQECGNFFSNQSDLSILTSLQQNSLNFNNLLRKQTEQQQQQQQQQQMNTNLLNQFHLLYQQHQLAQLTALKAKQSQSNSMNSKLLNTNNNNNNSNSNFQNNLTNINALYNHTNLLDNYMSEATNGFGANTSASVAATNASNLNNYFLIDSNQNIQAANLNKNNLNVSALGSLPPQTFMQQFISSLTPNSNSE